MNGSASDDEDVYQSRLVAFQAILDGSRYASQPTIDLAELRGLCAGGIPNHPLHLRPLAYSLLLGTLPPDKRAWRHSGKNLRIHYYALVKTHMEAIDALPLPDTPSPADKLISSISRDVASAQLRISLLKYRSSPSDSSPLAPPREADLDPEIEDDDDDTLDAYTSSSEDEADEPERVARTERAQRVRSPRPAKRLLCRRAIFQRVEALARAEHHRAHGKSASSSSADSPQKAERESSGSPEASLSPRITLSADEDFQPMALPSREPMAPAMETPQLSLSVAGLDGPANEADASSPITLLSPRPIPARDSTRMRAISGGLLNPDTHGDAICRLLFVFAQSNPQWAYHQGLVDIAATLYFIFLEVQWKTVYHEDRKGKGKVPKPSTTREPVSMGKWAEERTYWVFCALVREFEAVLMSPSDQSLPAALSVEQCLDCLGRRLHFADEPLWSILHENDLDPSSPVYASRWITLLLSRDLDLSYLAAVWDYVLATPPDAGNPHARVDALVDTCAAILLVSRKALLGAGVRAQQSGPAMRRPKGQAKGMWVEDDSVEALNSDIDPARQLEILRNLPLHRICDPAALLRIAGELRVERQNMPHLALRPDSAAVAPSTSWPSLASGTKLLQSYTSSETVSWIFPTSAKWTSAALSRVTDATRGLASAAQTSAPAGGFWGSISKYAPSNFTGPSVAATASTEKTQTVFEAPGNPYDLPPQAQTPPGGSRSHPRRDRSDSTTSGLSVSSLQDRLAGITSSFNSPDAPSSKRSSIQSTGPKPLLLSGSARRASGSGYKPSKFARDSTPTTSPPPGGAAGASGNVLSPPAMDDDGSVTPTASSGLYRLGSRQGPSGPRPKRLSPPHPVGEPSGAQ